MFVADDGVRLVVDSNVDQEHILVHHPEMRHRLEEMSRDEWVKFENFAYVPDVVQQALFHLAPMIPQNIRSEIVINAEIDFDTLAYHLTKSVMNADSLTAIVNEIVKIFEGFE
jgi:hypothetical protein